jgi:large subunit ribosomal protein L21
MYAVVTTGGKQYRVETGGELTIERMTADPGSSVTFDRVLLVGDGDSVSVGTPTLDGATVTATVLGEALGPKLRIFKFKQKVKYRRTRGHRQHLMRVRIDEINASGKVAKAPAKGHAKQGEAEADTDAPKARRTRKPTATTPTATKATGTKATSTQDATAADTEALKPRRTRKPAAKEAQTEPETQE